ncbi:MAG TPA: hypothetical protein VG826_28990 [Pirellulales bacterium]|nr:hypothetical protein [Pirellulales bacterium]
MRTVPSRFLAVVLTLVLPWAEGAFAQAGLRPRVPDELENANLRRAHPLLAPRRAQEKPLIADARGGRVPLRAEQLKLEVEWAAKVGGLDSAQAALLLERGANSLEKRGGLFLPAGGRGGRALQHWQIVGGRLQFVQSSVAEPPGRAIRRALMPLVKEISPDAADRVRAERDRLDASRKQASLVAQVAVLDECLLLSSEQRTRFCKLMAEATSDAWWRPTCPTATLDTATQELLMLLAEGGLGGFVVPEVDLAELLHPPQLAVLKKIRRPIHDEILLSQVVPRAGAAAALKQQALAVLGAPNAQRHAADKSKLDEQDQWLTHAIEQWVDRIDAAYELSPSQRDKLILAGRLDVDGLREPRALPEEPATDDEVVAQTVRVRVGADLLPLPIFRDGRSYSQRTLQSVLGEDQKKRLAESDRERRDFQRQALVEAMAVGFESSAAITAEQRVELSGVLAAALTDVDLQATDWRLECVQRIIDLPIEKFRAFGFPGRRRASTPRTSG